MTATESTQLVERYAHGLLSIVEAEGAVERVEDELYRFARALEANDDLRQTLSDANIPVERRLAVIDELVETRGDPQTVGVIDHILRSGRGRLLVEIADAFVRQAAERRSRAVAEVRTAVPLSEDQQDRLRTALAKVTGNDIQLKVVVDENVVGGVVATVGDTVIDGSVARQLAQLRARLSGM